MDVQSRLDEVVKYPVESAQTWDPKDNKPWQPGAQAKAYPLFRAYSDYMDGSFWIVSLDGSKRSALAHSLERLNSIVDYILHGE